MDYMSTLVEASRSHQHVRIGVSPRGTLALYKASQAVIRGITADSVIDSILDSTPAPVLPEPSR